MCYLVTVLIIRVKNQNIISCSKYERKRYRYHYCSIITESVGLQSGFNRMKFTLILQSHCLIVKPDFIVTMKFNYPQSS